MWFSRPQLDFYASSWIDELWVRTALVACSQVGLRSRLVLSGGKNSAPSQLKARYRKLGVPVIETSSVEELHRQKMKIVVTASSGIPRSFFGPTLERLVHMPHSIASLHMIYPAGAFDGYDTLFATGPHHAAEWGRLRKLSGLPAGVVRPVGYGKMDVLVKASRGAIPSIAKPTVMIAPSWGETNLLRIMGPELVRRLLASGLSVVLRPHPSFFLKDEPELSATCSAASGDARFSLETSTDVAHTGMLSADVLVTDYSGIAFEFAALRRKPTVFVDVPKKILNPDWGQIGIAPVEVALRTALGGIAPPDVDEVTSAILSAVQSPPLPGAIGAVVPQFLYEQSNVGAVVAVEVSGIVEQMR
jgi:hypothetical protein